MIASIGPWSSFTSSNTESARVILCATVNALVGQKALARSSTTPGRTRQINFFDLGGRLVLVDLPGYGYARAPKSDIAAWTNLVRYYLRLRPNLRRVCLLIDARHGPKETDFEVM